jgi:hypothetical protein
VNPRRLATAIGSCLLFLAAAVAAQSPPAVVLITLDGARVEEVFAGFDSTIVTSQLKPGQRLEDHALYRRYWAPSAEARREKLMPFFWGTLMREQGSIVGNPALGSRVHLTNRHWFSYPGYSEILVGRAHDDAIKSNDPVRNPNRTVLEFLQSSNGLARAGVAAFASWDVFRAIVEHREGALTVNAGYQKFESPDEDVRRDSALQFETPTPWDSVRHDAYTMRFALDHFARQRPRVVYLALGETDDWAHDGRYDRVLESYARTDRLLRELWEWLQSQPEYRGRTSLLITTDHGRGRTPADWRDHGEKVQGASETWMAFVSPTWSRRGEWRDHAPITASQAAATLITWMGGDWRQFTGAAPPVQP